MPVLPALNVMVPLGIVASSTSSRSGPAIVTLAGKRPTAMRTDSPGASTAAPAMNSEAASATINAAPRSLRVLEANDVAVEVDADADERAVSLPRAMVLQQQALLEVIADAVVVGAAALDRADHDDAGIRHRQFGDVGGRLAHAEERARARRPPVHEHAVVVAGATRAAA